MAKRSPKKEKKEKKVNQQKVICGIAMSIDGYVAGNNMTEQAPFGDIPTQLLHKWMFDEPEKHEPEISSLLSAGAYIMGRNMFGPSGETYDKTWKGWWGNNPPYHAPVFVLTHRERESIQMDGGTTFNFVTEGIEYALDQARKLADDKPIDITGGANVINQYLQAQLIDEIWLHIVPVTIGKGKKLFENVFNLNMEPINVSGNNLVTHIKYRIIKPKH